MAAGLDSPKKGCTLNPDAPLFLPSPSPVPTDFFDWSSEDFTSECPDASLIFPSQLNGSIDDLSESFELLDDELEDIPLEWNVDDFSPDWWNLVQTSPSFREFWLRGYEIDEDYFSLDILSEESHGIDPFDFEMKEEEDRATSTSGSRGVDVRFLVERMKRVLKEPPSKYHDKIPQVSPKKAPACRIQQPR